MSLVVRLFVVILLAWLVPVLVVLAMMEAPVSFIDGWVALPLVGALAVSLWAGQRWFARPLSGLTGTAGRWRSGNVAARSDALAEPGEIGHLARTFDEMAGSAASVAQQLESARAELRRADAKAQQVAQATARTLSAASHDLRQPLQAMNLSVSLLSSRHRADNDTAALGRITRSIQQLGHQIDLLVQTTRLQAGLVVPKVEPVALQPLIESVTNEFAEAFEQKSLTFVNTVCDRTVRSDPQLLTPILRSLLANAVRFTPAGGSIRVECESRGDLLRMSVRDTGVGMTLDRRIELAAGLDVDPQSGADRSTASLDGSSYGLGTGLTMVRQASRLLGHAVGFESALGEGSSFHLDMPRVETPAVAARATPPVDASQPVPSLRGRLLLVEDDAQSEDGTAQALRATGLKVVSALELDDALDTLESEGDAGAGGSDADGDERASSTAFDALLVRRPPIDAREAELCRTLRERFPSVRLLVIAEEGLQASLRPLEAVGVSLLAAPLTVAAVAAALPELVERAR